MEFLIFILELFFKQFKLFSGVIFLKLKTSNIASLSCVTRHTKMISLFVLFFVHKVINIFFAESCKWSYYNGARVFSVHDVTLGRALG